MLNVKTFDLFNNSSTQLILYQFPFFRKHFIFVILHIQVGFLYDVMLSYK